jgi:hypothetical protein
MELALEAKGPVAAPPVLDGPSQRVAETVASWQGVIAATHWHFSGNGSVDGADFYVGARELGHIHLDGEVHLATDTALRDQILKSGEAKRFFYDPSWVMTRIASEVDADRAIGLFRKNYERLVAF